VFCVAVRTSSKFALYIINRLVLVTEVESVYCAVRTEFFYMYNTVRLNIQGLIQQVRFCCSSCNIVLFDTDVLIHLSCSP
jgi:hypothetical protein